MVQKCLTCLIYLTRLTHKTLHVSERHIIRRLSHIPTTSSAMNSVPDSVLSDSTLAELPLHLLGKVTMVCLKLLKCANATILQIARPMLLKTRAGKSPASLLFAIRVMEPLPCSIMSRRDYQSKKVSDTSELQVRTFGCGSYGQLGHPFPPNVQPLDYMRHEPQRVEDLRDKCVVQMAAGSQHTIVLTQNGQVFTFGKAASGRLGHGWTEELANNPFNHKQAVPRIVESLNDKDIVQVAAGAEHSVVLTAYGEILTFGYGRKGQLGHGVQYHEFSPKKVDALAGIKIIQVAAGINHTVVLADNGDVFAFGDGSLGQLGADFEGEATSCQATPYKVVSLADERVVHVAAGADYTAAVTSRGEVFMFGLGCQLKHAPLKKQGIPFKVKMPAGEYVVQVALASGHSAFVTEKGEMFTFGYGHKGRLGHSLFLGSRGANEPDTDLPQKVSELSGKYVVQVALGCDHSVALTKDGRVYTFGCSRYGQLGHGHHAYNFQCLPRAVGALYLDRVFQIAAGTCGDHTMVLCRSL